MSKKLIAGLILVASAVVYVCIPHRTEVMEVKTTLQNGKKMEVHLILRSPFGWLEPSRVCDMQVSFDGNPIRILKEAFRGISSVDSGTPLVLGESNGYPMIIMMGHRGGGLKEVRWGFLNYSLSERQLWREHGPEITYYSTPWIEPKPLQLPVDSLKSDTPNKTRL